MEPTVAALTMSVRPAKGADNGYIVTDDQTGQTMRCTTWEQARAVAGGKQQFVADETIERQPQPPQA